MSPARTSAASGPANVDIAIVTILPEEYDAVKRRLLKVRRDRGEDQPNQYAWVVGEIKAAQGGAYRVVLAMTAHPGNTSGSLAISKTIARWNPRYVLLVGIAGGLPRDDLGLGDVVVSKQICSYEYGKIDHKAFNPRPDFLYQLDGSLLRNALSLDENEWRKGLVRRPGADRGRPKRLFGMVGSGDKVIDDRSAGFFRAVEKAFSKLQAVEMEGAGAAAAIQEARDEGRTVGFLMIRGISDMPPDGAAKKPAKRTKKNNAAGLSIRDQWKLYAADVAASFAVHFISQAWPVSPGERSVQAKDVSSSSAAPTAAELAQARARYFAYLRSECSEIQLEGLPADEQVGSRMLRLEQLFVPLHVVPANAGKGRGAKAVGDARSETFGAPSKRASKRRSFGAVLANEPRLAILAPPGGGKSTLLKRVAMAYAFPDRRGELDDDLPSRKWFPLLVRCRELAERAGLPIVQILKGQAQRAEINDLGPAFEGLIDQAIRDGSLLLLVDGLDEIADEGQRAAFVQQLHLFLSVHADVALIVTSREAGFRVVAHTVAKACREYLLAEFDDDDVERLTVAWHREVVGDRPNVLREARALAQTIARTDRVRRLARNPLLLTTLLLVKRWVGELPAGRIALYQKAIEVLLMTWNVEAHRQLERNEVIPQLAFLAFIMMKEGLQQISERRLREIFTDARRQMEDLLAYTRDSVDELIRRVEHRSSLLVQSGHVREDGRIWPVYEFRHLTFQEYLAALAVAEGNYPGHRDDDTVLSVLRPHVLDPDWKEVIPLAAVLAGRSARTLIWHLVEFCEESYRGDVASRDRGSVDENDDEPDESVGAAILAQCLVDGVVVSPSLVERALLSVALSIRGVDDDGRMRALLRGRYSDAAQSAIVRAYVDNGRMSMDASNAMDALAYVRWLDSRGKVNVLDEIREALVSGDTGRQALAALMLEWAAYERSESSIDLFEQVSSGEDARRKLSDLVGDLEPLVKDPRRCLHRSAAWACAWLGDIGVVSKSLAYSLLPTLFELWRSSQEEEIWHFAAWALAELPLLGRDGAPLPPPTEPLVEWLVRQYDDKSVSSSSTRKMGSLVVAYYWKQPWSDEELVRRIVALEGNPNDGWRCRLLHALGRTDLLPKTKRGSVRRRR